MNVEAYIHALLCNYLRTNYPDAIFTSDLSGVRLPMGLAKKVKPLKSSRGIPDLIVLYPVGNYHGLLMELKTEDAKVLKADGTLYADDHLAEQLKVITQLRTYGYAAFFVRGFAAGRQCIQDYMTGRWGSASIAPLEYVPPSTADLRHTKRTHP